MSLEQFMLKGGVVGNKHITHRVDVFRICSREHKSLIDIGLYKYFGDAIIWLINQEYKTN